MIWIPSKYEWYSLWPLLWTPNFCEFANLIHIDVPCPKLYTPTYFSRVPHLNELHHHPSIYLNQKPRSYLISLFLASLPITLPINHQFAKCISNTGKARMWDIFSHLAHDDIAFPLIFFSRAQSGGVPQFKKVVFQEFTDGSFTQPLYRGELNEHLGLLGPYIRAEVEDNIMVSWGQWNCKNINSIYILVVSDYKNNIFSLLKYRK